MIFSGGARAETVVLQNGSRVTAAVIKQTAEHLFLDLGYDVIAVPRRKIVTLSAASAPTSPDTETAENTDADQTRPGIAYRSAQGNSQSTSEGVNLYGPAIVVVKTPRGMGSGFFVNPEGYLLTNFHVIRGQRHIAVTRFEKSGPELKRIIYKDVRIVALDSAHDLAVLQVSVRSQDQLPTVNLSPVEAPVLGDKVFVIGNPLGLERTVTEGVLSHTGRLFGGNLYLQIDASVNPGNSGGPLFNAEGEVIGVVNMSVATMQGLNFAIPVRHVKFLLDHIVSFAYDQSNSESGYFYLSAPGNPRSKQKNVPQN